MTNISIKGNYPYINEIVSFLNKYECSILSFFGLENLNFEFKIEVMNYNDFKSFLLKKYNIVRNYVRGDFDPHTNTIRILNLEDQKKYTTHKDTTLDDMNKMILHEFVHFCNNKINSDFNQTIWFKEGIATNLSKQNYNIVDLSDCDFEKLKNNFNEYGDGNYSYSYTIVNYVLKNYDKKEIEKLLYDSDYLRKKSNQIFSEAKINTLKRI